jgi:hypothetical protein
MKQKSSPKKVLSLAKQKMQTAVNKLKQRVAKNRAENLYERLIGIKTNKKIVVSPKRLLSPRPSVLSPVTSVVNTPVTSPKKSKTRRSKSRKM